MSKDKSATEKNEGTAEESSTIRTEYIGLSKLVERKWGKNPKFHDIGGLVESIRKHGFRDSPIWDEKISGVIAGNGRVEALEWMKRGGEDAPRGVRVGKDGEWYIPVQVGIDSESEGKAAAFGLDHNNLTMSGGDVTIWEMGKIWEEAGYKGLLREMVEEGEELASISTEDIEAYLRGIEFTSIDEEEEGGGVEGKRGMRIIIEIENTSMYERAVRGINELLSENKEWKGSMK